ncbi:hypothetical protein PR202_gb24064 [Eleusine coracana subsp. coracana]|uniref:Uncharacterized protein n=1 Tax=Eleusine coracana subsp. coracana TaxID=191504 RepID=A0AAV5FHW1_ELECO|nr:hypothetical protein PR202_gb24064 [Eleusine coracana subsp. coracana]
MDKIPDWFWPTFSQAIYINISNNKLSGSFPANLGDMAVVELYLGSNCLTGPIPPQPRNITILDISNNSFSGTLPPDLEAKELQTLIMYSNQIGGTIPRSLCKLNLLTDLDLSSNLFEGEIPRCFETEFSQHIVYLLLSNNSLSGAFPAFLQKRTDLEFLDLAWNSFFGSLPAWIGNLSNLHFLRLSHNTFSGNIPEEITSLSYLRYLDLSGNNLSSVIPRNLTNLTAMTLKDRRLIVGFVKELPDGDVDGSKFVNTYGQFGEIISLITKGQQLRYGKGLADFVSIDMSGNSLTGEIPSGITSLDALISLNLSSNNLFGDITKNIGAMRSLESLDLSKNKLFGEIPSSISNLTSLSYLNLSYNNLSGQIPLGRQLDTLSADKPSLMYIGNSGLCGPPLQNSCSGNENVIHGNYRSSRPELEPMSFDLGFVLGLVMGLWMVFCALLFKKTWRIAYFQSIDKLNDRTYVFVVVKWTFLTRKKVGTGGCRRTWWMVPGHSVEQVAGALDNKEFRASLAIRSNLGSVRCNNENEEGTDGGKPAGKKTVMIYGLHKERDLDMLPPEFRLPIPASAAISITATLAAPAMFHTTVAMASLLPPVVRAVFTTVIATTPSPPALQSALPTGALNMLTTALYDMQRKMDELFTRLAVLEGRPSPFAPPSGLPRVGGSLSLPAVFPVVLGSFSAPRVLPMFPCGLSATTTAAITDAQQLQTKSVKLQQIAQLADISTKPTGKMPTRLVWAAVRLQAAARGLLAR